MENKDRLYQSFGELLYVAAMSDGVIDEQQMITLEEILLEHPKGKDIKWSFDYENANHSDINTLYRKVIEVFSDHGPDEEYEFMHYALTKLARASEHVNAQNKSIATNFSTDLLDRFTKDAEKIKDDYQP
ncbi:TerB family tellurite resistance protein [Aquimarina sp. W85]|uniref:TerB family tellurite resistance protein n=1 Tax=Aquimarina rhodophyticola TaxID=3342246 RepID=UPI0036704AC5